MPVNRILTLLMILVLVVAPGVSVSAAACRHDNAIQHALARSSPDARVANAALTEETAASLAKKGTLSDAPSGAWLADMLSPPQVTIPWHRAEPIRRFYTDENVLPGTSVLPLLQPPSA